MYVRTVGKTLWGTFGNYILRSTPTEKGILTEVLDGTGKVLKSRTKIIETAKINDTISKVCKGAFPTHSDFEVKTVKNITNIFGKGKPTTVKYTVERNISGVRNGKRNSLLREFGAEDRIMEGCVYEPEYTSKNHFWGDSWNKRKISIGVESSVDVPRPGTFMDTIDIPLKMEEHTGAWNRRYFTYKPQFDDFSKSILGDRTKGLEELIDISTYNPTETYTHLVDPKIFW